VAGWEAGKGRQVLGAVAQHRRKLGELPSEHPGDDVQLPLVLHGVLAWIEALGLELLEVRRLGS
jgi:hypothetical protein